MRELGQILVTVGVLIVILGVAVAAVQAVIKAIKAKEAGITKDGKAPTWPEKLGEIVIELIKQGGGLAIAAVGLVLIYVGLQTMNAGTLDEAKALESSTASVFLNR